MSDDAKRADPPPAMLRAAGWRKLKTGWQSPYSTIVMTITEARLVQSEVRAFWNLELRKQRMTYAADTPR